MPFCGVRRPREKLRAVDGRHSVGLGGLGEPHGTVEAVVIGEGDGIQP